MKAAGFRWIIFISFCVGQDTPEWFLYPPRADSYLYGIGIAARLRETEDSFLAAEQNAIEDLCRQIHVRIVGRLADVSTGAKGFSQQYTKEITDSTLYYKIAANVIPLKSILTHRNAYVLMLIKKDLSMVSLDEVVSIDNIRLKQRYSLKASRNPRWIKRPPKRRKFIYGVGLGLRHRNLKDSWDNSAKQARMEIAKQIDMGLGALELHVTGTRSKDIIWIEESTNVVLNGAIIIERWHDEKRNIYYTLEEYSNLN